MSNTWDSLEDIRFSKVGVSVTFGTADRLPLHLSLFGEEVILDVGEAAHRSFLEVFATLASLSAGRLKRDPKEDLGTAVLKDADRLFRSTSSFGL